MPFTAGKAAVHQCFTTNLIPNRNVNVNVDIELSAADSILPRQINC
jgi:hypothetical protein